MSGGDSQGLGRREKVDVQVQEHAPVHHPQAAPNEAGGWMWVAPNEDVPLVYSYISSDGVLGMFAPPYDVRVCGHFSDRMSSSGRVSSSPSEARLLAGVRNY